MPIVRVQTDWYAHDTEFRYVLQAGEGIHASHALPIGQVFLVPREEITQREATAEELETFRQARRDFQRDKAGVTMTTPYGLQYSPHYARRSRMTTPGTEDAVDAKAPSKSGNPTPDAEQ